MNYQFPIKKISDSGKNSQFSRQLPQSVRKLPVSERNFRIRGKLPVSELTSSSQETPSFNFNSKFLSELPGSERTFRFWVHSQFLKKMPVSKFAWNFQFFVKTSRCKKLPVSEKTSSFRESSNSFPDPRTCETLSIFLIPFLCCGGLISWTANFDLQIEGGLLLLLIRFCIHSIHKYTARQILRLKHNAVIWIVELTYFLNFVSYKSVKNCGLSFFTFIMQIHL